MREYRYEQLFHAAGIELELVTNEEQNIKKLKTGRLDLVLFEETAGWYMVKSLFPDEREYFYTLTSPLFVKDCFLMTSTQYPEAQYLLSQCNAALKRIKGNGTFQQLMKNHGVAYIP